MSEQVNHAFLICKFNALNIGREVIMWPVICIPVGLITSSVALCGISYIIQKGSWQIMSSQE